MTDSFTHALLNRDSNTLKAGCLPKARKPITFLPAKLQYSLIKPQENANLSGARAGIDPSEVQIQMENEELWA